MDKFFIITNELKDKDFAVTDEITRIIEGHGHKVVDVVKRFEPDDPECFKKVFKRITPEVECIITLGGDGTILRAARNLYRCGKPFLGINLGNLGYLTEGSKQNAEDILEKVFKDEYYVEERMLISGKINHGDSCGHSHIALNDITLNRNNSLRIIRFNLYVNGELLYNYKADGIIVSTPTGSTAYNLSCGGPIATPTARLILITPIAPHSLNNRSLVLSASDKIEIEIVGNDNDIDSQIEYIAYFDGDARREIKPGERIEIVAEDDVAKLIRLSKMSFLETLKEKMS